MSAKVSLALITKNEELCIERCIKSFAGAVDEIIVCDTGSTDKTIEIATGLGARIVSHEWKDDFAEARQASFDACTGQYIIWCDADDVLAPGCAQSLRWCADQGKADVHLMPWKVEDHILERERLIRRGCGRWSRSIHEKFDHFKGSVIGRVRSISIIHLPPEGKVKNHDRNVNLLRKRLEHSGMDLFYLSTELAQIEDKAGACRYAHAAMQMHVAAPECYELLLVLAHCSPAPEDQVKFAMQAYNLDPKRREALVLLCQWAFRAGRGAEGLAFARAFNALPKPTPSPWTLQHKLYEWAGEYMMSYALRYQGEDEIAQKFEWSCRENQQPTFSLVHATRGRAEKMNEIRQMWFDLAEDPRMVEHVFCVDGDDEESIKAARGYPHVVMNPGGGCVAAWNAGATQTSGKVLIQLSDDWLPPKGWDRILLERFGDKIDGEYVLGISDGIDRGGGEITKCMCMAIMTRARYQFQGHMFFHGYKSVYSDNEFTDRAYEDGVVIEARDVVFKHVHPLAGEVKWDKTYLEQNAPERYKDGEALYLKRKVQSGGLQRKYAAFILAAKDDICLFEVVQRMKEEGVSKVFIGVPGEYWNGEKNDGFDDVCRKTARLCTELGVAWCVLNLKVAKHRAPDRDILITEAMVRNEALDMIRADGFEHVLVVDGDELWKTGTLRRIDRYILDNEPTSLCCAMIPVAGLPGYPIEGARDLAMIYLGPGGRFKACRGSEGNQFTFPRRQIIHFSATRRTMDEIIQKHRESGHYGDPAYPFEEWIRNTLPNIKPGMTHCHPFTLWDCWPLCRHFTKEEWADIPESIHQYLGAPNVHAN